MTIDAELQARADAMQEAMDRTAVARDANKALEAKSRTSKIHWLRRATEPMQAASVGHVACREGCSHCCHISVPVTEIEAQVIAKEINRPLAKPPRFLVANRPEFTGVACTFLKNNRCSIYDVRPFQCRIHFNVDLDEQQCTLEADHRAKLVPYFNKLPWVNLYCEVHGLEETGRMADIREWFPPTEKE